MRPCRLCKMNKHRFLIKYFLNQNFMINEKSIFFFKYTIYNDKHIWAFRNK